MPILVAVRGQCLGGGLEVALAGGPIFAAPDAQFGQPEMKLGVFAPAASVLLPYRVNLPAAEDLLYSGRSIGAEPRRMPCGLVHAVADDPEIAALGWFHEHLPSKSAAALACAIAAARGAMRRDVRHRLAEVETPVPRPPDGHARRQRRPGRLSREAQTELGASLMVTARNPASSRSSSAAKRCSKTCTSTPSSNGRPPRPAARRSATCRCTCRAS